MQTVNSISVDSKTLLFEMNEYIYQLNNISDEEAKDELRCCETPVLHWLLYDVAIPNNQYDIAGMVIELMKNRIHN